MNELLPHLLRPGWLLLLPVPIWLLWMLWHRQRQIGRWQRLLPEAFHSVLLTRGRLRTSRRPWIVLGTAWLLAGLALLGPSWQHAEQPGLSRTDPLVVLLDTTPAMLAADASPNRLAKAKRKILDLLQARPDAQTAVVAFAGSAHTLVPLSNDIATTQNLLDALQPELMPEPGRRADLAVARGLELLAQGANGRGRLLLIGSELSPAERDAISTALAASDQRLLVLGVGTEQGAPITREDGSFFKDAQGAILIPRLDEHALRQFAEQVGGRYQRARLDDADLKALGLLRSEGPLRQSQDTTRLETWLDQGYWLLLPLLLLASTAGRRGWLLCLPLLMGLPQPASAFDLQDLWLNHNQQGKRLLEAQHPAEAAQRFDDPRWQGYARYQAGDFAGAAEQFAKGDSAADHYNRGNALARDERLEAAIEAYEQALDLDPELDVARRNKTTVETLLRDRQQQAAQAAEPDAQDAKPDEDVRSEPRPTTGGTAEKPAPPSRARDADQPAGGQDAPQQRANEPQAPAEPEQSDSTDATLVQADEGSLDPETGQALEQWLRRIPDNPGELLRRKFLYEQRKRQELER
ncbi:VWA domain-containing protein [Pseudomonas sp.]|uniref:VWA domain-containing protein n=1 Tax=Pseudomonas sp. TaxID=306 RepID=UPI0028B24845|nr:VWA domain-containing protein [Pseudomonas sp.]